MTLKRITLQLARNPGLPAGDPQQGYLIVAPLTDTGQLDAEAWPAQRKACRVFRFHPDPAQKADGWAGWVAGAGWRGGGLMVRLCLSYRLLKSSVLTGRWQLIDGDEG